MTGKSDDTELGGPAGAFPRTTAGLVGGLAPGFDPEDRPRFEELCRRYWKPVYAYLRITAARTNEDAKDLTQSFFAWLLERDVLSRYREARGRFRTFLIAVLKGFLADHRKSEGRLKRGGGTSIIRFDAEDRSLDRLPADPRTSQPEAFFDQMWFMSVLSNAVERVRERADPLAFRVFEARDLNGGAEPPSYAEVAARLGIRETQVRDLLAVMRRELREEVRAEIARQTRGPEDLEGELDAFLGA